MSPLSDTADPVDSKGGAAPKLYRELASWWPLISSPDEYAEEAAFYRRALAETSDRQPQSLLELGSGGGNNASHLKTHFQMTLVDASPAMLAVSRALNPECEHVEGDMRTIRLERQFDAVFVHDAVCYMTTASDIRQAMETAFVHCKPSGVALFAPDYTRESFRASTSHGGHDGEERSLRYLEWTWDPDPTDSTYVADYVYVLRSEDGSIRVEHDRHIEGLFSRVEWLGFLAEVGFRPIAMPFEHTVLDPCQQEVFIGRRPHGTR